MSNSSSSLHPYYLPNSSHHHLSPCNQSLSWSDLLLVPLQTIHHTTLRETFLKSKDLPWSSIIPLFKNFQWLSSVLIINTQFLTKIYKVLDDLAPTYLSKFLSDTYFPCLPCCSQSGLLPVPQILFLTSGLCLSYLLCLECSSQALSLTGSLTSSRSQPKYPFLKETSPQHSTVAGFPPDAIMPCSFLSCTCHHRLLPCLSTYLLSVIPTRL